MLDSFKLWNTFKMLDKEPSNINSDSKSSTTSKLEGYSFDDGLISNFLIALSKWQLAIVNGSKEY
jgi:hypothetical protein